jgi:hypothetical protein
VAQTAKETPGISSIGGAHHAPLKMSDVPNWESNVPLVMRMLTCSEVANLRRIFVPLRANFRRRKISGFAEL